MKKLKNSIIMPAFFFIIVMSIAVYAGAVSEITDTEGRTARFASVPGRVVSIVPSTTEIICSLGASDSLKGVTYHGVLPREKYGKTLVGGFSSPSIENILALNPDLVFVSKFQEKTIDELAKKGIKYFYMDTPSFDQGMKNIEIIGDIFNKKSQAGALLKKIQDELDIIRKKTSKIPESKRKRVFRLMGRDKIMTPAKGAFLNDLVKFAGGIPMEPQGKGIVTEVSLDQWKEFNPQVIFGCGEDRRAAEKFFGKPGWKDVDAVKNNRIYYFPCELTCRASSHAGYFVQWLSSYIYEDEFFKPSSQILPDEIIKNDKLSIDLGIVKDTRKIMSRIGDFQHKTLVIDFNAPQNILSTLEGFREDVSSVANHYLPPPSWSMPHSSDIQAVNKRILKTINRTSENTAMLMTGADMDNLAITKKNYKDMEVYAAVTAGVLSNAQRMSRSRGLFYEPGTINIILITNTALSKRAMTRAIITATEAKSAALADLDIRSTFNPLLYQATGTGTDNIIIVQGQGTLINGAGGHTKMGELIAGAVYDGVKEAVFLQNGLTQDRHVFQRLKERGITIHDLAGTSSCQCNKILKNTMAAELEHLLIEPEYASIVETAFALTDAQGLIGAKCKAPASDIINKEVLKDKKVLEDKERREDKEGLKNFEDPGLFEGMCIRIAEKIAGKELDSIKEFSSTKSLPGPLAAAFNSIMTGIEEFYDFPQDTTEPPPSKETDPAEALTPPDTKKQTSAGNNTLLNDPFPKRIISLGPVLTKTIYLLGAGDRLIADTTYCEDLDPLKPKEKIGSLTQINVEKIISLKPDLVLASQFTKEKQLKVLDQFNIRTIQFKNPENFEKICSNTIYLGQLTGRENKARQIVAKAAGDVLSVQHLTKDLSPKRVFIQIGIKPIHTSNENTFVNEFIKRSGGINIAGKEESGIYSREKVVKENPDVILISTMGSSKSAGAKEKAQWMAFNSMTAVQNHAIHLLDSEVICSPTPLVFARSLKDIALLLHPELSSKLWASR